jgi:hypothetical protein
MCFQFWRRSYFDIYKMRLHYVRRLYLIFYRCAFQIKFEAPLFGYFIDAPPTWGASFWYFIDVPPIWGASIWYLIDALSIWYLIDAEAPEN